MLRRKFNLAMLKNVMTETTKITCMVFIILVGARAFSLVFNLLGGDEALATMVQNSEMGPKMFLLTVMVIVFIAGFFIDFIEITFILVPIIAPIFQDMGIDLLWVGILLPLNLQTSFLTPPFGFALFYLKGVAPKEVTTGHIYRGIIPYIIIQLIALGFVIFLPETALWLPAYLASP